jgi:hypothetical protein
MSTGEHSARPSADEQAGIAWWKSLSQPQRAQAFEAAGWKADGMDAPSVADAWTVFKQKSLAAAAHAKPPRYVVLLGRYDRPYVFDTLTKFRLSSYPTVAEAERRAISLNGGAMSTDVYGYQPGPPGAVKRVTSRRHR